MKTNPNTRRGLLFKKNTVGDGLTLESKVLFYQQDKFFHIKSVQNVFCSELSLWEII